MLIKIHKKYYRFWLKHDLYNKYQYSDYYSTCFSLKDYVRFGGSLYKRYYICG